MVRLRLISLLLAALTTTGTAQSDSPPEFLTGQVGVLALDVPSYPGSDERWIIPVPLIDIRLGNRVYVGGGQSGLSAGAGVILFESPAVTWSADLSLTSDRPDDRADALAGMGDRGFGVFGGSSIAVRWGLLQASASWAVGVEDRMGSMGTLGLSAGSRIGARWFGQLGGLAVFSNCRNMAWEFGVTERQAEQRQELLEQGAPGIRPGDTVPFSPEDCGLRELRATGTLVYAFSPRLSLMGTGTGIRLENAAAESPLTRERNSWEAGLGVAWRF